MISDIKKREREREIEKEIDKERKKESNRGKKGDRIRKILKKKVIKEER